MIERLLQAALHRRVTVSIGTTHGHRLAKRIARRRTIAPFDECTIVADPFPVGDLPNADRRNRDELIEQPCFGDIPT